jgi:glycine cleavage system aminomethyltransferase T
MYARHDLAPAVSPLVHRDPVPAYRDGRRVGRVTSICWGPTIKKMVGFASLDRGLEREGTRLSIEWSVEGERGSVDATVVPTPFLNLERKRT